jgi:tetratricopeptide (TPR) repeat protein
MNFRSPLAALAWVGAAVVAWVPSSAAQPHAQAANPVPAPAQAPAATKLQVGDPAPGLALDSFVKGTPVAAMERGKTYLLQFWAPWKKDSLEQFAQLSALQKRLGDQGLVVIGIASADVGGTTIEKVRTTIDQQGDAVQFAIAWDKGTETKDAFLKAAGRTTLPCAALVDKDGKIALIENIQLGRQFVESVVKGTHDLAALGAWQVKASRAPQTLRSLQSAYAAQKWADVLDLAGELIEVDPISNGGHAQLRMLAQVKVGAPEKAIAWGAAWIDGPGKESSEGLNAVAWALVDPQNPFPNTDLDLALKAAQRSVELTKSENGAILDTLARVYFLKGDAAKAVEIERLALTKLTPELMRFKPQLEAALKEYEAALAKK